MSIDRIVAVSPTEKMASRSKIMKRGADSKGKASRICCATQPAVGLVVTAQRTTSRRPWRKSIAAMPSRWFRRNVIQVVLALGVRGNERRSLETLRSETSEPRRSSSPRIRGAPGVLGGHPPDERSDLERQERIVGSRAMRRRSIEPGRIPALGEIVNCSSADSFG